MNKKQKENINTKPLIGDDEAFATFEEVLEVNDYIKSLNGEIQELNPNDFETKEDKIGIIDKSLWIQEGINGAKLKKVGNIDLQDQNIVRLRDSDLASSAATKKYVDNEIAKVISNYIIGELKWVKVGTQMPEGWVKAPYIQGLINNSEIEGLKPPLWPDGTYSLGFANKEGVDVGYKSSGSTLYNYWLGKAELWEYNPSKYAEIIALGLTPREYALNQENIDNLIE